MVLFDATCLDPDHVQSDHKQQVNCKPWIQEDQMFVFAN